MAFCSNECGQHQAGIPTLAPHSTLHGVITPEHLQVLQAWSETSPTCGPKCVDGGSPGLVVWPGHMLWGPLHSPNQIEPQAYKAVGSESGSTLVAGSEQRKPNL